MTINAEDAQPGLWQQQTPQPLAAALRPQSLAEYIGQSHLLGPGKPLRKAAEQGQLHSMILWGPPGTGKTTLAELLATAADAQVLRLSAVTSGVKDIREAIAKARAQAGARQTLLFVDEVHRFNKSQQDAFLPHIEDGTIVFVGATTENPGFALNNALLSRARMYRLVALTTAELAQVLEQALENTERGLGRRQLRLAEGVAAAMIQAADGDARRLLNNLEVVADFVSDNDPVVTLDMLADILGQQVVAFDNQGDHYYDLLSAFHKSVRGSDPDAALYWYARILVGGGDPLIIARRLLAIATEDIGTADPRALQLAVNAWDTFARVGPAEGERAIAQAAVYCACAAKSNALYTAFNAAVAAARDEGSHPVPEHLRNAPTKVHKAAGFGVDYRYAHHEPHAYVAGERYLPSALAGQQWYQPSSRGMEQQLQEKLARLRALDAQSDWQRDDTDT